jgi:hypothetical protein
MSAYHVSWISRPNDNPSSSMIARLGGPDWSLSSDEVIQRIESSVDVCGDIFFIGTPDESAVLRVKRTSRGPELLSVSNGRHSPHLLQLPCRNAAEAAQ